MVFIADFVLGHDLWRKNGMACAGGGDLQRTRGTVVRACHVATQTVAIAQRAGLNAASPGRLHCGMGSAMAGVLRDPLCDNH